ncbi:helix-turn-helix transcriptional regulator [Peribacillus simplex]|uniref:helix-turn-helix domain-containing protein n=1 Tax=Peribacillus simplex TaxID=1478 RepID=UPI002E1B9489|nr:helix-turn-helix transcriptional regulator [Peribacillus simplex]
MLTGKQLKIKRIMLDIKAIHIAELLEVHRSYISILESGKQNIPLHIRTKWESYLNKREEEMN